MLKDGVEASVFRIKQVQDKPCRIVIDLTIPELEKKESEERKQVKTKIKDKVIIIDPGHGGEDPGAIGRKRTKEKDVVLKIAKMLQRDINSIKGYRAFLTRSGDYYPSFKKRLQIAREYGADLFVSIHADAARNRNARGGSVYCLSTSGASSAAARILARNENLADMVGGDESDQATEETDPIMLDMIQTQTINLSKNLAADMLARMHEVNKIKFARVQEAPLRVLKLPHIPSILVETAYISNPVEEQLLKDPIFQKKLSRVIAASIVDFLSDPGASPVLQPGPAVIAGVEKPRVAAPGEISAEGGKTNPPARTWKKDPHWRGQRAERWRSRRIG